MREDTGDTENAHLSFVTFRGDKALFFQRALAVQPYFDGSTNVPMQGWMDERVGFTAEGAEFTQR